MTEIEREMFLRFYNLTETDKGKIVSMKNTGCTIDEIARRFQITPPDVTRVLHPIEGYNKWTAEEKERHWLAGLKRAQTVKRNREIKTHKYLV